METDTEDEDTIGKEQEATATPTGAKQNATPRAEQEAIPNAGKEEKKEQVCTYGCKKSY